MGNLQLHKTERQTLDSHHFKEEIKRNFKTSSDKQNENTAHKSLGCHRNSVQRLKTVSKQPNFTPQVI